MRSVQVERYDDWVIIFFSKKGTNRYDRRGFYWGVPSSTSAGWCWAIALLELCQEKRATSKGKSMMGAIFHPGTGQRPTPRRINLMTQQALHSKVANQQKLGILSWRRYWPKMVESMDLTPEEKATLGDWHGRNPAEKRFNPRYPQVKLGPYRTVKAKLARVQVALRKGRIGTSEDISPGRWQEILGEASADILPHPTEVRWRNPDTAHSAYRFAPREPRRNCTMPEQLGSIYLTPTSRDRKYLFPLFQQDCCDMDTDEGGKETDEQGRGMGCRLGKHMCAAMYRTGRACHGQHPGGECRQTSKHWKPEGRPQCEVPAMGHAGYTVE